MGSADPPAQARSPLASRTEWPLLGLLFVAIAAIYFFFVSAGTGTQITSQSWYFEMLAHAFLDGNTYLHIQPFPRLLAQANPYDPAHSNLWLWDATLHEGRYYLYWGPVPALLVAAVKGFAGRTLAVGDGLLVLAFVLGRLAVGMAILALSLRWLFPRLPPWHAVPAVAVFGLANPYLFGLGRVGVDQGPRSRARSSSSRGLADGAARDRGARSRRHQLVLGLLAGCAWGAALATRISLVIAVGVLVPLTAWMASLGAERLRREAAIRLVWIGAPVAFTLFWLGVDNYARFGSWTEFGAAHQLGFLPQQLLGLPFPAGPARLSAEGGRGLLPVPLRLCTGRVELDATGLDVRETDRLPVARTHGWDADRRALRAVRRGRRVDRGRFLDAKPSRRFRIRD